MKQIIVKLIKGNKDVYLVWKSKKGYVTTKLKNNFICIPELKDVINKFKIIDSKVMSAYGEIKEIDSKINFFILSEQVRYHQEKR